MQAAGPPKSQGASMPRNETTIWQKRLFWLIFTVVAGFVLLTLLTLIASAGLEA
jgi:hypothetical protein